MAMTGQINTLDHAREQVRHGLSRQPHPARCGVRACQRASAAERALARSLSWPACRACSGSCGCYGPKAPSPGREGAATSEAEPVTPMLAYRVYPDLPGALPGSAGHPLYLDTHCSWRLDNPERYQIWYLALEPAGAVAETFGDLDQWDAEMFMCPSVPGS